jgi:hypothetical protein
MIKGMERLKKQNLNFIYQAGRCTVKFTDGQMKDRQTDKQMDRWIDRQV